jgi:1-acyl-sn-glycerol-3-phosphate acyltransferase
MLARIDHAWRWFGTAFSFFMFGVGGIVLAMLMVPVLYCLPGDELSRQRRAQLAIHHIFRWYVAMLSFLGVIRLDESGADKLKHARLILANHPSLLDVVLLMSMVPNANCIVKGKLTRNYFVRGSIRAAGYIINEEESDVVAAAARVFDRGQALIIFPEGTRTSPGMELDFKRGAANVAVRTGSDITPVLIYCRPTTLTKNDHWYQVPSKRVKFRILVQNKIDINRYVNNIRPSMGARKLTSDLVTYFHTELKAHG